MTKTQANNLYNEIEYGKIDEDSEERRPRNFQQVLIISTKLNIGKKEYERQECGKTKIQEPSGGVRTAQQPIRQPTSRAGLSNAKHKNPRTFRKKYKTSKVPQWYVIQP